jgi:hypothetical protein
MMYLVSILLNMADTAIFMPLPPNRSFSTALKALAALDNQLLLSLGKEGEGTTGEAMAKPNRDPGSDS